MRRVLTTLLLLLALTGMVAQAASYVTYEALTVADTAVGITAAILDPPGNGQMQACQFLVTTAAVNLRFDGVAPTSSTGVPLEAGMTVSFSNHADAQRALFIRSTGVSGVLKGHCWR
jgi:hypothetical protein